MLYALVALTCSRGDDRVTFLATGKCRQYGYVTWNFILVCWTCFLFGIIKALDPTSVQFNYSEAERKEWKEDRLAREQARALGKFHDNSHKAEMYSVQDDITRVEEGKAGSMTSASSKGAELDR